MRICSLGDLVLDVIVRLDQPLATGADATSRIVLRPGGQAANVAAWVAALGGSSCFIGKRGRDEAGHLAATGLAELGVELLGPVEPDGSGVDRGARRPGGRADDVLGPRRCAVPRAGGDRGCVVRGLRASPRVGICARPGAGSVRRRTRDRRGPSGRRPDQHRPLLLERDPRLRRRAVPLAPRSSSPRTSSSRTRTRNASSAARSDAATGSSSGARAGRRSTASSTTPPPVAAVVDSTGAGDAFAAGWLVGGPALALEAGARCVQIAGSMPDGRSLESSSSLGGRARADPGRDEVQTALEEERAVVALETTLVAHGFPAPDGVETGLASEAAVRAAGAVPATIGVLDGQIRIGLTRTELERFTPSARKLGPRDLAVCAVQRAVGATTVGGTLVAAAAVGIRFMGTGGLGGVHRGFPTPPDVSADLVAAARSPGSRRLVGRQVASRRARHGRAPRDARRTRDRLPHRHAAAVLRRGRRAAGVGPRRRRCEIARIADGHWRLGGNAILVGRPPTESLDVAPLIEEAVAAATREGVSGQAVTPVRARVPPRALRRRDAPRQPRPDRRQRRPRRRDRRRLRDAVKEHR